MGINNKIANKHSKNAFSAKRIKEMAYIRNHFENYIKENVTYMNKSLLYPDYKTQIMTQVIEYTDGMFTLPQLYIIYLANSSNLMGWSYDKLSSYKVNVLKEIDEALVKKSNSKNVLGDVEEFRRKVMELNPIIFHALSELMYNSNMFLNNSDMFYDYPDIEEIDARTKYFNLKKKDITPEWIITKLSQTWYMDDDEYVISTDNTTDSDLIELALNTLSISFERKDSVCKDGKKIFKYCIEDIDLLYPSLYKSMVSVHGNYKTLKYQAS
jgi:hypothetical protein